MSSTSRLHIGLIVLLCFVTEGCARTLDRGPDSHSPAFERRCGPPAQEHETETVQPSAGTPPTPKSSEPAHLSAATLEVADLIGVRAMIEELARLKKSGQRKSLEFIDLRQRLTYHLLLTMLQVSGTVAEINCERDRTDQVADRMDEVDTRRVKWLTLTSILIGGVASIVSGVVGLVSAPSAAGEATDVAGGVFESGFGGTALFTQSRQEFQHERNLLKEVWQDTDTSSAFPPTIWRFLRSKKNEQTGKLLREELITAWRQEGRLGAPGSSTEKKRRELLFGAGGVYTAPDLRARASMLETLQAEVTRINEELELLAHEVLSAFDS